MYFLRLLFPPFSMFFHLSVPASYAQVTLMAFQSLVKKQSAFTKREI